MDALLYAVYARGLNFDVIGDLAPGTPWRRGEAGIRVGDLLVGVSLFERMKKTRSDDRWCAVVYLANGLLCICVHGDYGPFREWTDTKTKAIKFRLHEVIPSVLARAEVCQAKRVAGAGSCLFATIISWSFSLAKMLSFDADAERGSAGIAAPITCNPVVPRVGEGQATAVGAAPRTRSTSSGRPASPRK
jgi:hypothetical protein